MSFTTHRSSGKSPSRGQAALAKLWPPDGERWSWRHVAWHTACSSPSRSCHAAQHGLSPVGFIFVYFQKISGRSSGQQETSMAVFQKAWGQMAPLVIAGVGLHFPGFGKSAKGQPSQPSSPVFSRCLVNALEVL